MKTTLNTSKPTRNTSLSFKRTYRAFALLSLCLVGFAGTYSWVSWQSNKADELRHAEQLAELGEKSLNAYFSQIEFALRLTGQDLLDERGRLDPIAAQSRLIGLVKANPNLVSANIISLDGFIILSSNPEARLPAPVPNIASLNHYIGELSKGQSLGIGLPFIGPFVKEWLIPLRYAVRDAVGNLRYVLTATMPLSRPQSFWQDMTLPAGMALGLVRDDGYLVSRYPVPKALALTEIYGKPRTGALMDHLQQKQFPISGHVEGSSSLGGPDHLFVFRRLSNHPLTFFVTQPMSNMRANWWSQVEIPYLLLFLLLAGGYAVFRWMLRSQTAWEAERNEAEKSLHEAQLRLGGIIDSATDAVISIDAQHRVVLFNSTAENMFGYAAADIIGQPLERLIPGNFRKLHSAQIREFSATGVTNRKMGVGATVLGLRANGEEFPVEASISQVSLKEGAVFTAILRDTTDRNRAEQALLAAKNAAEMASGAKDSFLATMSHEIRTPLGGLLGMLELLSLSPLDPDQGDTLQSARDSGRSLLRIVNDILDWSKIEEGKLELAPQATSTAQLVAEVANTYAHVASGNSVTLAQQVDGRLSPALMVDPLRLSQVLNNFVSNAIKFSHGGRVELRAELIERHEGAERVRFSVKDTGIGIDKDVQQRLFQTYGQGSADTARMYGGTGLGLAICRRLADMMDGRIELESAPGRGSTFSITLTLPVAEAAVRANHDLFSDTIPLNLPLAETAAATPVQSAAGAAAAASAPPLVPDVVKTDAPLVLVVDDHPINRRLLALQLEMLGLRAQTAEHGEAGLALWRDGRYALVITDCHMPVMDGYALTRAIRGIEAAEARPRTPIFAWTANALADEIENCSAAGMDELLVKPADLAQLKQALEKWLPIAAEPMPGLSAPHAPQTAAAPAVDVNVLKALVGGDAAVVQEFLQDFRTGLAAIAAELRAACLRGQATAAGAAAHKLKSSARSVGAHKLGDLCSDMEQQCKAGDSAAALLPGFEQELAAVDGCLDSLLQRRPTAKG